MLTLSACLAVLQIQEQDFRCRCRLTTPLPHLQESFHRHRWTARTGLPLQIQIHLQGSFHRHHLTARLPLQIQMVHLQESDFHRRHLTARRLPLQIQIIHLQKSFVLVEDHCK